MRNYTIIYRSTAGGLRKVDISAISKDDAKMELIKQYKDVSNILVII